MCFTFPLLAISISTILIFFYKQVSFGYLRILAYPTVVVMLRFMA